MRATIDTGRRAAAATRAAIQLADQRQPEPSRRSCAASVLTFGLPFLIASLLSAGAVQAQTLPAQERSIREWATCDATVDSAVGIAQAFKAARNGAFTLVVDCPVLLHVGEDVARTVFIDHGTSVKFSGTGTLYVDNIFVPAFALVNTNGVNLINWRVQYIGGLPADQQRPGYYDNGVFVAAPAPAAASYRFNDTTLKSWMANNRGITFLSTNPPWAGPTSNMALFQVRGDTSNVNVKGMRVGVPATAGGHQYVPVVFSFISSVRSGLAFSRSSPNNADTYAVPHHLSFDDVQLDGTYMGWLGNVQDSTFTNIKSLRYGDLQDASGGSPGGVGKWFPPPHLFYLNYAVGQDTRLYNRNLVLSRINDYGYRAGVARDTVGSSGSGYANSLKIGGNNVSIDQYYSQRPDGLLDLLPSDGLTIHDTHGSYDSTFLHGLYPGIRFPSTGYRNITITASSLEDRASGGSSTPPIGWMAGAGPNDNVQMTDFRVSIDNWVGSYYVQLQESAGRIYATQSNVDLYYSLFHADGTVASVHSGRNGDVTWQITATPSTLFTGSYSDISWSVANAARCESDTPNWSAGTTSGTQSVTSLYVNSLAPRFGLSCIAKDGSMGIRPFVNVYFFDSYD